MNDKTSFVYHDGSLVPVEDAKGIEESKQNERRFFPHLHLGEDEAWKLVPDFIQEKDFPIYQTVVTYTLEAVKDWLSALADEHTGTYSQNKKYTYQDLVRDIDKSMLLDRILRGYKTLPKKPPKSYGVPWYDLIDRGEDICIDVWFNNSTGYSKRSIVGMKKDYNEVTIDSEKWKIDSQLGFEKYVVIWPDNDEYRFILSRITDAEALEIIHPRLRSRMTEKAYSWKLTRMEKKEDDS